MTKNKLNSTLPFDLIVVGGGAAGFFGAIVSAETNPTLKILILEKTPKLLSKVKVSGGGRCNVTHNCFEPTPLSKHYPRGQKELKEVFRLFHAADMVTWLVAKGVSLKVEEDGRMFPTTNDSQTIIDCFLNEANRLKIQVFTNERVDEVIYTNHFIVKTSSDKTFQTKKLLVAMGGHNQPRAYEWIEKLGHKITTLIPSLFTFNDSQKEFTDLMGISVPNAKIKIAGTKFFEVGPLLITHWGLSGPAVIKLSAWAAEHLHQINYQFTCLVSWIGDVNEDDLRQKLKSHQEARGKQSVLKNPLFELPQRLWTRLCQLAEIEETKIWAELPTKNLNKLIEFLIRCPFNIKGKTTFKEEFVTCGGVDLKEIDLSTMQSKKIENLFFAGEVLNIDGETGGFNFQAAWTTAWVAANAAAK
jgi:predicted Rossmann fold flavoprotein